MQGTIDEIIKAKLGDKDGWITFHQKDLVMLAFKAGENKIGIPLECMEARKVAWALLDSADKAQGGKA